MSIVAFTRELGSLGTYIAEELAKRRGFRLIRREILEEAAKVGDLSEARLIQTIEDRPGLWERLSLPAHRGFHHVAASVLEFAAAGNVVILGRWSTMLLRGVRHAVRVRVCAPPEVRTARLMKRMSIPHAEAQALSQRYDDGVRARLRQFFDVEWEDSDLYDLVINTERITIEEGCALIERLLDTAAFQPDDASRREVQDRALAARVAEAMKLDERTAHIELRITARGSVVTLHGLVFTADDRAAAADVAGQTPGVTQVNASITIARMPPR
jgi:cytidylate kinase